MAATTDEGEEKKKVMQWIGLNQVENYDNLVSTKWAKCCQVLDNLISFDGSGKIDPVSLVNILESVGITENLDTILRSAESVKELTRRRLETSLLATVQQMPNFPLGQIFDAAINSNFEHQTVLIVGLLGRGKSALSQYLACGYHDPDKQDTFVSGDMGRKGGGVTQEAWVGHFPFLGKKSTKRWVTIIDTPGGNDENLPNYTNFKRLQTVIKKARFVNTILLVVTAQDIMRRTESLNTYLQEFSLMMQQDNLSKNVAVVISRGNMLVPAFFPNEERFQYALDEAIMIPLRQAFGNTVPEFRLSMAKMDYISDPRLEEKSLITANTIYENFLKVEPIDTQQMEALETRVKRLIKQHVKLEEEQKQTKEELQTERDEHKQTKETLATAEENLQKTSEILEVTTENYERTSKDLENERDTHKRTFNMLNDERDLHKKSRAQFETERKGHMETQKKWDNEVEAHHRTQEELNDALRQLANAKNKLETAEVELGETKRIAEDKEKIEKDLEQTRTELEQANKKLEKKGSMCIIS